MTIEFLPIDQLTEFDLVRHERSLTRQLARGVPEGRVPAMLARLDEIRARQGRRPLSPRACERAAARARFQRLRLGIPASPGEQSPAEILLEHRALLEQQPIEGLSVEELLSRRRALMTTTAIPSRQDAIQSRLREIDRLLGVTPSDWGRLRMCVRTATDLGIDLGCHDLEWTERRLSGRRMRTRWRQGIVICFRIEHVTKYKPSREAGMNAWHQLVDASDERIQWVRRQKAPTQLDREEVRLWWTLYQEHTIPWPAEGSVLE